MKNDNLIELVLLYDGAFLAARSKQDIYCVVHPDRRPHRISVMEAVLLYREHGSDSDNLMWAKPKRPRQKTGLIHLMWVEIPTLRPDMNKGLMQRWISGPGLASGADAGGGRSEAESQSPS